MSGVVIAGAGHAGFQAAASLRQDGYPGPIKLINGEDFPPYQRPPLSKGYFKDGKAERLLFRNPDFYAKSGIELIAGVTVETLDRAVRSAVLSDGRRLDYDHLVLALGAVSRMPPIEGLDAKGILELRTLADAEAIRTVTSSSRRVVIVGGGFIGLEAAAVFAAAGLHCAVLEASDRLMGRAVSPVVSDYFLNVHRTAGVDVRTNAQVRRLVPDAGGSIAAVELADGTRIEADAALIATGVAANDGLAAAAGLPTANGVVVDRFLGTVDENVSAIGDCAAMTFSEGSPPLRLESVQAAVDQAKCVSARIVGRPTPYASMPWFWSDQGPHKLQIVGLHGGVDRHEIEGSVEDGRLIVRGYRRDRLICVETVNAPAVHIRARKTLSQEWSFTTTPQDRAPSDDGRVLRARDAALV